jgi:nicotinamide mononucleotide (NMN) deamidase PncC
MSTPSFEELIPSNPDTTTILQIKTAATRKGYELLQVINEKATWADKSNPADVDRYLQIATSESLTCGLIMSTLVDIPWGGFMKYGGFGVYDTDAKRVFNHVSVDDVYTHKCASEMAIGILKNSNATLAISVTGNAMPLNEHANQLGEVFIGIAGYNDKDEIIFVTKSINMCIENDVDEFKTHCKTWYNTIILDKKYNPRSLTATVSQEIRYYTALKAYELCIEFVRNLNPTVPNRVLERKKANNETNNNIHNNIPLNKYDVGGNGICKNLELLETNCNITGNRITEDTKLFNVTGNNSSKEATKLFKITGNRSSEATKRFKKTGNRSSDATKLLRVTGGKRKSRKYKTRKIKKKYL